MGKDLIQNKRFTLVLFFLVLMQGKVWSQETVRDNFSSVSYSNNDGTQNWSTDWIETNDTGNRSYDGYIRITGGELRFHWIYRNSEYIERTVDLSMAVTANLEFDWRTVSIENNERLTIQISSNGSSYTDLGSFNGSNSGHFNTDISSYLSSNTTIRFINKNNNWEGDDYVYIDNVVITYTLPVVKPTIDLVKSFEESCNGNDGIVQFYETTPAIDSGIEFSKDNGSTWQSSAVFTGLSAGNYTLRVRNGSVVSDPYSITVGQFSQLTASANVSHANCGNADGSIDVTVSGGRSGSMQTDGSTGVIDLQGRLLSGLGAFSLEGWVKLNQPVSAYNSGQHSFFGQNDVIEFGFENGAFTCWTASGGNIKETLTNYPDDQKWHHVAVVGTGSSLKLFIDGNVVETRNHSSISSYGNNTGYSAKIGAGVWDPGTTSEPFEGVFSDVRFWDDARSDAEILNNRNTNIQGNEQGLIAVYKMNTPPDANKIYGIGPKATIGTINSGATWIDTNPVYTYSWTGPGGFSSTDEDISNLQSGSYTLTVKDLNNCTVSQVFQVNEISGFTASASADKSNICEGESVLLKVDSPVDSSMLFDGSDDWLLIPSHNNINLQSVSSRTIMLRFKPKDITTRQVLYEEGAAVNGFSIYIEGNKVNAYGWVNNTSWPVASATLPSVDKWYHVAFTWRNNSGPNFRIYLDGNLAQTVSAGSSMPAHSGDVRIGNAASLRLPDNSTGQGYFFNGNIDNFRLWNGAELNQSQIQAEVNSEVKVFGSPIVEYNFNDAASPVTNSGSAGDATINGGAVYQSDNTVLWNDPTNATTYSISVSPVSTTTYNVTVTNENGCSDDVDVIVNVTPQPKPKGVYF